MPKKINKRKIIKKRRQTVVNLEITVAHVLIQTQE